MEFASFAEELEKLVTRFAQQRNHLFSTNYDESSLRNDYLTPFWRALGWDFENEKGFTQLLREVQVESRIEEAGVKKRADYLFRTDGIDRFVCEAKKPKAELSRFAYQAQRYSFNLRLLVSILSNFDRFQVFIVGGKPDRLAPWAAFKTLSFTEYVENSQFLWDLFSRDAVANGSLDRWVASLPKKEATGKARQGWLIPLERIRTVDIEFLEYFEEKRERLAKLLTRFNSAFQWDAQTLTECVQRILDRILFVRICEDREIDTGASLSSLAEDYVNNPHPGLPFYSILVAHFNRLDETFNGQLFKAGHISESCVVPNSYLTDLITELSNEDSPYLFNTLPVEILGNVYERFIGKAIRLTKAGVPHIEDKPENRKQEGIFYTPQYVVNFTVEEALGNLIVGKSPRELSRIKVLDPSCGSGSFLIRVFERFCLEHLRWFTGHASAQRASDCYSDAEGNLRLTTHYKRQILLDNIFGVDLDSQAAEVTMLSLYLKILEGENKTTLGMQRALFPKETFLPDLKTNIKCGNSLIDLDYWRDTGKVTLEARSRVNAFSWASEFNKETEVFDAIVGNPPWGAAFTPEEKTYLSTKYSRVVARMPDSYIYFIDRSESLLKKNAPLGFVIPSTILNQVDAQPVRHLLLTRGISSLLNLGAGIFGSKVLNTTTVIVSKARLGEDAIKLADLTRVPLLERKNQLSDHRAVPFKTWKQEVEADPYESFLIKTPEASALFDRIRGAHGKLQDVLAAKIERGVSPDNVAAHVLSPTEARKHKIEARVLKRSISGSQVKKYTVPKADQFIVFTTRKTDINLLPNTKKFLSQFKAGCTCKEVRNGKHPWYALHRARKVNLFNAPKIIGLTTAKTIELVLDQEDNFVVTDAMYVFRPKPGISAWSIMAVMQSKTFLFLYRTANQGESRVIPQVKAAKLHPLPFPTAEALRCSGLDTLAEELTDLHESATTITSERAASANAREAKRIAEQIEQNVRAIYGLTAEEGKLIDAI